MAENITPGAPIADQEEVKVQAGRARALGTEIDDHGHLQPRRMRHLRQKHRTEFSGADQRDVNRFSGRAAGVEQTMKVHGRGDPIGSDVRETGQDYFSVMAGLVPAIHVLCVSAVLGRHARHKAGHDGTIDDGSAYSAAWRWLRASRSNASSSTVLIGVKSRWAIYSGRVGVRM